MTRASSITVNGFYSALIFLRNVSHYYAYLVKLSSQLLVWTRIKVKVSNFPHYDDCLFIFLVFLE